MFRRLRLVLVLLVVAAGGAGAGWIARPEGCARATVRVTAADPRVSIDPSLVEADLAAFLKAQGVTNQAGWTSFVNNMTAAQHLAFDKARLLREVRVDP